MTWTAILLLAAVAVVFIAACLFVAIAAQDKTGDEPQDDGRESVPGAQEPIRNPMPPRPCPKCGALTPRWLEQSSNAIVSYYRCEVCKNVWSYPKGQELTADPRIVTIFPDDVDETTNTTSS